MNWVAKHKGIIFLLAGVLSGGGLVFLLFQHFHQDQVPEESTFTSIPSMNSGSTMLDIIQSAQIPLAQLEEENAAQDVLEESMEQEGLELESAYAAFKKRDLLRKLQAQATLEKLAIVRVTDLTDEELVQQLITDLGYVMNGAECSASNKTRSSVLV